MYYSSTLQIHVPALISSDHYAVLEQIHTPAMYSLYSVFFFKFKKNWWTHVLSGPLIPLFLDFWWRLLWVSRPYSNLAEAYVMYMMYLLYSLEVGLEPLWLVSLDLTVLDGPVIQEGVELHRLVGRGTVFILRAVLPDPEVQVPSQLVTVWVRLVCLRTEIDLIIWSVNRRENGYVNMFKPIGRSFCYRHSCIHSMLLRKILSLYDNDMKIYW